MKTLCFLLVLGVVSTTSHTQTILKPTPLNHQYYGGDSVSFDSPSLWASRTQNRFFLGWQWAGPNKSVNERLHCNFQLILS